MPHQKALLACNHNLPHGLSTDITTCIDQNEGLAVAGTQPPCQQISYINLKALPEAKPQPSSLSDTMHEPEGPVARHNLRTGPHSEDHVTI